MKPLKGSRTEANLMAAFAGETQARTKYTYYASQAKKDGYVQISKIFEETAANEKEHAKMWFKELAELNDTPANLAAAADGAHTAKAGSAQLANGASALYDGVLQLQNGTDQLSGGLVQFNDEGISQLTGALDADQLHALQTVVEEMTSRLADYTSFSGVPEGASSRVKFLYKTAEPPAETAPVETAADNASEGNFFLRLWHRLLALFGF